MDIFLTILLLQNYALFQILANFDRRGEVPDWL